MADLVVIHDAECRPALRIEMPKNTVECREISDVLEKNREKHDVGKRRADPLQHLADFVEQIPGLRSNRPVPAIGMRTAALQETSLRRNVVIAHDHRFSGFVGLDRDEAGEEGERSACHRLRVERRRRQAGMVERR